MRDRYIRNIIFSDTVTAAIILKNWSFYKSTKLHENSVDICKER
jgi:hypothetical protein